jgi:DNA primase large subunit
MAIQNSKISISSISRRSKVKRIEIEKRSNPTNKTSIDRQETVLQTTDLRDAEIQGNALDEQIRRRAYELYEQRGMQNGFEVEDWLQAEAEVLDGQNLRNPRFKKAA